MPHIFKNIRRKLAAQNKALAYLRYAIGEIFLVVIGILIALQVNNWNEARKDRIQERKFLNNLDAELKTDLYNISSAISANQSRKERAEFLLKTKDHPQLAEDSSSHFVQSIEYAGYTYNPLISNNTFEEIKSSGKLSLIRNDKLRAELQQYYSWSSDRGQYNFIKQDIELRYLHAQQGILSAREQINMGSYSGDTVKYSPAEAEKAYERMMKKTAFLSIMPNIIQSQIRFGENEKYAKGRAIHLISMIEDELGKPKTIKTTSKMNKK